MNNENDQKGKGGSDELIDDVILEEDGEHGEVDAKEIIRKLKERLKKALSEKQEYLDGWQRAKADFINIRKKDNETNQELIKFAEEGLIGDILPVIDSFEQAFSHKEALKKLPPEWQTGMQNIHNQLMAALIGRGVSEINPVGEYFDPTIHEAVGTIDIDNPKDDHKILDVVQKGYKLQGKPLRTARVRIGKFEKEKQEV